MNRVIKTMLACLVIVLAGCQTSDLDSKNSVYTGLPKFDKKTTNFEAYSKASTGTPPDMLVIPGGTFTIGTDDEFVTAPRNNTRRTLTVSTFYMDKYEVSNEGWREYVHWIDVVFGTRKPELVEAVLPDTTVWREALSYNDPLVEYYFRSPDYAKYPVVGVSWDQAMAYCQWRTDRVNEALLVGGGYMQLPRYDWVKDFMTEQEASELLQEYPELAKYEMDTVLIPTARALEYGYDGDTQADSVTMYQMSYEWVRDCFVFNTEKYQLSPTYNPEFGKKAPIDERGATRKVQKHEGRMHIGFRLPTEAEWEYAAFAPIATDDNAPGPDAGRLYPWSGYYPRDVSKKSNAKLTANFIRGRGDMMGVAKILDDGHVYTARVDAFAPNDFGLYNMAGNVNEWVLDVFRETTGEVVTEYNPYRGNVWKSPKKDEKGQYILTEYGTLAIEWKDSDDLRDYKDGDKITRIDTDYPLNFNLQEADSTSKYDPTDVLAPKITKNTRVYKGGSWNDRIYWLNPSSRRYMEQNESSCMVGFRCAMNILGDEKNE